MGFFDNIGKKASAAYDATAEKTGKIAKEAKLRMKINEDKSDINDLYKEIGKKVYEKHVREENIDIRTDLEEECSKIDVLSAEIETCLKSILELRNKKKCPKCDTEMNMDAVFCPNCGEKQPDVEERDAEAVIDDLENADIKPENETEKKIVEEKVSGAQPTENAATGENNQQISSWENQSNSTTNTVEKVTEVHAVEVQEDAKKAMENNQQQNSNNQ